MPHQPKQKSGGINMKNNVNLLNRLGSFIGGFGCALWLCISLHSWTEAPVWFLVFILVTLSYTVWFTWGSVRGKLGINKKASL